MEKKNKLQKPLCHLVSRVVLGVNVKVPAMQGRGSRRCHNEAREVDLNSTETLWRAGRLGNTFQWLPLDGAV